MGRIGKTEVKISKENRYAAKKEKEKLDNECRLRVRGRSA